VSWSCVNTLASLLYSIPKFKYVCLHQNYRNIKWQDVKLRDLTRFDSTNVLGILGWIRRLMRDLTRWVRTFAFMWKEVKEMGQFQLAASSRCLSARRLFFWIIIGQLKYYCRWQSKEVGFSLNYLVHVSSHFRALTFEKWLPWTRCINMCGCSCNPALSVYDWFFDSILNVRTTDMWFSNFYSLWSKGQQS